MPQMPRRVHYDAAKEVAGDRNMTFIEPVAVNNYTLFQLIAPYPKETLDYTASANRGGADRRQINEIYVLLWIARP